MAEMAHRQKRLLVEVVLSPLRLVVAFGRGLHAANLTCRELRKQGLPLLGILPQLLGSLGGYFTERGATEEAGALESHENAISTASDRLCWKIGLANGPRSPLEKGTCISSITLSRSRCSFD